MNFFPAITTFINKNKLAQAKFRPHGITKVQLSFEINFNFKDLT
jgi:hypothetical protein